MRLSAFTDYGLRMLMRIAGDPDRAFATTELACEFGLSRNHLIKIIGALAKARIVKTQRGRGGGAMLARPASAIRLGDVMSALEAGQVLVECFGSSSTCTIEACCTLKGRLRSAQRAFIADLNRSTLADCALGANVFSIAGSAIQAARKIS